MNSSGVNLVANWGLLIVFLAIVIMLALIWCHDVNQKLRYILDQLAGPRSSGDDKLVFKYNVKENSKSVRDDKAVPQIIAIGVIATAILFLFAVPLWLINR